MSTPLPPLPPSFNEVHVWLRSEDELLRLRYYFEYYNSNHISGCVNCLLSGDSVSSTVVLSASLRVLPRDASININGYVVRVGRGAEGSLNVLEEETLPAYMARLGRVSNPLIKRTQILSYLRQIFTQTEMMLPSLSECFR